MSNLSNRCVYVIQIAMVHGGCYPGIQGVNAERWQLRDNLTLGRPAARSDFHHAIPAKETVFFKTYILPNVEMRSWTLSLYIYISSHITFFRNQHGKSIINTLRPSGSI